MTIKEELLAANDRHAAGFEHGHLPPAPSRRLAVVTCMDARLDPARFLGLGAGEAHVLRNAGAVVTDDVVRSLVISHRLLGTEAAVVIAHSDCGMLTFTNDDLWRAISEETGEDARSLDFLPFSDLEQSVRDGIGRIGASRLLPTSFEAHGFVYDVRTGRLREVAPA